MSSHYGGRRLLRQGGPLARPVNKRDQQAPQAFHRSQDRVLSGQAPHRSRRHVVTYPAIADMLFRRCFQEVDIIPPLQALRARYARIRTAVDTR